MGQTVPKRGVEFDVKDLILVDFSSFSEKEKRSYGRLVWNPENKEKFIKKARQE